MKVLWITNTLFPDICRELNLSIPFVGGWMFSGAKNLLNVNNEVKLAVASTYNGEKFISKEIKGVNYFLIPQLSSKNKYCSEHEIFWKNVKHQFDPDVVHIHGTEYPYTIAFLRACGNVGVAASIQGLVSVYERYYFGGIEKSTLRKQITLRDRIKFDSLFNQHVAMKQRGQYEIELIKRIKHIIGRTSWDRSHAWAINKNAKYHFCNETLRDEFYCQEWKLKKCEKYSIFLSQAHYPIKGLHQILRAMPFILRHFPETKIYIAGNDFVTNRGWKLNGFGKHIRTLIKDYKISEKVIFTGVLQEQEMSSRYAKSHVFVCPSSIENSPNSIGEAQLIGTPCISSYVGGIPDMIVDDETGLLYRFEEVEMLAAAVCRIFSDDNLAMKLSQNARKVAVLRHNRLINAEQLYSIYNNICKK